MRPASLGYCAQRLADSLTATTKVPESRKIAAGAIRTAAETKDNPADLINIALEELVKSNCELPGYTTLNRMAGVTSVRRRCLPPATFDIEFSGWVPTLELTVYVRAQPAPGPVRVLQRAQLVTGGRVDQTCLIWDRTGRLVAEGTQLAAIRLGWFPFLRPGRHGRGVPGVLEDQVEAGRGPGGQAGGRGGDNVRPGLSEVACDPCRGDGGRVGGAGLEWHLLRRARTRRPRGRPTPDGVRRARAGLAGHRLRRCAGCVRGQGPAGRRGCATLR